MSDLTPDYEELLKLQLAAGTSSDSTYRHLLRSLDTHRSKPLEPEVYKAICNYLTHPTRVGIWRFQATWLSAEGISKAILAEIEPHIESNDDWDRAGSWSQF